MKGTPFKIYQPADKDEIQTYIDSLRSLEPTIDTPTKMKDLPKYTNFKKFLDTHCVKRTYYFHVKKCSEPTWPFHAPMRIKSEKIETFPDPIPYIDEEGVKRFKEGFDEDEKYLTSKLIDVSKRHHGFQFSPFTQHVKTVSKYVKCAEWMQEATHHLCWEKTETWRSGKAT